jgi:hypothetical protein
MHTEWGQQPPEIHPQPVFVVVKHTVVWHPGYVGVSVVDELHGLVEYVPPQILVGQYPHPHFCGGLRLTECR